MPLSNEPGYGKVSSASFFKQISLSGKTKFRAGLFAGLLASLPAFALEPLAPPAAADTALPQLVAARMPTEKEKFSIHSVPDTYFGVNPARRGSLVTGLLLGPLGVLINTAYTEGEGKRQADTLKEIFSLDLAAGLKARVNQGRAAAASGPARFELVPAAIIFFIEEDRFVAACALSAILLDEAGKEKWRGRYISYLKPEYSITNPQTGRELARELPLCLDRAYDLYKAHLAGAYAAAAPYRLDIGIPIKNFVDEKSLPDRIVALDNIGVNDYRKETVLSMEKMK